MGLDWPLAVRYALLSASTHLVPVPLLDLLVDVWLRRRLTRLQLRAAGIDFDVTDVPMLGDPPSSGCLSLLLSSVLWPVKKLIRTLSVVLLVKAMADTFSEVVHHAVLVDEALALRLVPGDTVHVRAAMQRARQGFDTSPVSRVVVGVLGQSRAELVALAKGLRARLRFEAVAERHRDAATDLDHEPLAEAPERLVRALVDGVRMPELQGALRARLREEAAGLTQWEATP